MDDQYNCVGIYQQDFFNILLELYYHLKQARHDVGYISKGWNEPGFRVGEMVEVPNWKVADMKEHVYALLKFCATRGVTVTVEEKEKFIEIQLDSVST